MSGIVLGKEIEMDTQKYKDTRGKPRVSLVPTQITLDIARVREYGVEKYPIDGRENYKNVPIEHWVDAAYRHMLEVIKDFNSVAEDSGLTHLSHLACDLAIICELREIERVKTDKVVERDADTDPAWFFDQLRMEV
jgi:hypothetical protein